MQLDINSETGLKAFRSLHRLGCLQKVQQADLKADVSNAAAIGHLTLLGTCTHLKELRLAWSMTSTHASCGGGRPSSWIMFCLAV